jgi:hypothetical protein
MDTLARYLVALVIGLVVGALMDDLVTMEMLKDNVVSGYDCQAKVNPEPPVAQVP